jgi:hypothetical protein
VSSLYVRTRSLCVILGAASCFCVETHRIPIPHQKRSRSLRNARMNHCARWQSCCCFRGLFRSVRCFRVAHPQSTSPMLSRCTVTASATVVSQAWAEGDEGNLFGSGKRMSVGFVKKSVVLYCLHAPSG